MTERFNWLTCKCRGIPFQVQKSNTNVLRHFNADRVPPFGEIHGGIYFFRAMDSIRTPVVDEH